MAPSMRTVAPARATLLSLVALGLVVPTAVAATESAREDKPADVTFSNKATPAQEDTVDIRRVHYEVGVDAVTITTTFRDLEDTAGHQFVESHVKTGDGAFVLSSELGRRRVFLYPPAGHGYGEAPGTKCLGSRTIVDYELDTATQRVPLECWDGAIKIRVKTAAVLVRNDGSEIARDKAERSKVLLLG